MHHHCRLNVHLLNTPTTNASTIALRVITIGESQSTVIPLQVRFVRFDLWGQMKEENSDYRTLSGIIP
jgi:hypothetical protein